MLFFAEETRVTLYKTQVAQVYVQLFASSRKPTTIKNNELINYSLICVTTSNRRVVGQQHLSLSTYVIIVLSDRYKVGSAGIVQSFNFYKYSLVIIVNDTKRVATNVARDQTRCRRHKWLETLLVLSFAPRGFSLGDLVFPSPRKPSFLTSHEVKFRNTSCSEFCANL